MGNPATGCTCGSGAHPRRCEKHPLAFELHAAKLDCESLEDERDELAVANGELIIERDALRAELAQVRAFNDLPEFANDASTDVGYWQVKAREHWTVADSVLREHKQLESMYVAMVARVDALRAKLDALRTWAMSHEDFLMDDDNCSVERWDEFRAAVKASREDAP